MSRIMQDVPKLDNYYNEVADTPTSREDRLSSSKWAILEQLNRGRVIENCREMWLLGAIIIYYTERHELREPFVFINVNSYYLGD